MSCLRRFLSCATWAVVVALPGCNVLPSVSQMPINHYFADSRDIKTVRRILVLPLQIGDNIEVDERMLRSAFVRELNLLQRFQVQALPSGIDEEVAINRAFAHGGVSIPDLVELSKRYKLDGVMIGRVTSYRPWVPPHVGIEARLFSLHTGNWVWIADATFDANSAACMDDLRHYVASATADGSTAEEDTRMVLLAPSKFAAYACHRLLGTWR